MPEVINKTVAPITFHHNVKGVTKLIKIPPFGSEEISAAIWKKFKKNKAVKKLIEDKEIHILEKQKESFFKRVLRML